MLNILDIIGTIVFALAGAEVGARKQLDIFGMFILAFATAVGGGTIRDAILDVNVFWAYNPIYIYLILASTLVLFIFKKVQSYVYKNFFIFTDALGLGAFAVMGCQKGLISGVSVEASLFMGILTGCFGGVIRDVLVNEVPNVLKQEFYASSAFLGALAYYICYSKLEMTILTASIIGVMVTFLSRVITYKFKYNLPSFRP